MNPILFFENFSRAISLMHVEVENYHFVYFII